MNHLRLHSDTLAIAIFLILSATYAASFGFVSPDSWNYVRLAQSLVDGNVCQVNGKYFAIFPCGYPITLALSSLSQDPAFIIIISKFTNAGLLLASFLCFRQLFPQHPLIAALIIIAPSTISISHFTWSENLFLFATALSLLQVHRLAAKQSYLNHVILLFALLVGISSRYFFGPFAALIWLATLLIYGKETARRTLPAFAIAGVAFIAYYFVNINLTGYGTGMQRIPAPESLLYLVVHFFWTLIRYETPQFFLVLIFFHLATIKTIALKKPAFDSMQHKKGELLILAAGFSFLFLSFALRATTQFDLYGFRTVGYGHTFIFVAIYALLTESKKRGEHSFFIVILACLISFGITKRAELKEMTIALLDKKYVYKSIANQIYEYQNISDVKGFNNVVSFSVPSVGKTIASNHSYYYDKHTNLITPSTAPYGIPEGLDSFFERIRSAKGSCVVDFKVFNTEDEFAQAMQSTFDVDLVFDTPSNRLIRVKATRYDEQLASFLMKHYEHQKLIECSKFIEKRTK